jgi:hypothetical protein
VVFTKLDLLREQKEGKLEKALEQQDRVMEDKEFEVELDAAVDKGMQELCIKPLRVLSPGYQWIATSSECTRRLLKPKF